MQAGGHIMTEMYDETQRQRTVLHYKEGDLEEVLKELFDLTRQEGESFDNFKMRMREEFDIDDAAEMMESDIDIPLVPDGVPVDTMTALKNLMDVKDHMDDTLSFT